MKFEQKIGMFLCAVIFLVLSLFFMAKCDGFSPNYSTGHRVGVVQKFSVSKGIFFKSGEGTLLMSGMRTKTTYNSSNDTTSTALVNNTWEFSVTDPEVSQKIEDVMMTGGLVRLEYKQWLISPYTQDTSYVVTGVEVIK